jgi:hypothetical protein
MHGRANITLRSRVMRRHAPATIVITVVLALAAACGGDPDVTLPGPDSTTPPLARSTYLAQANEICRATTKAVVERTQDVGGSNLGADSGNRQKLLDTVEPITSQAIAKLRNLTPPPEDAATAKAANDQLQAAADAARDDPTAPLDPVGIKQPQFFAFGLSGCFANG